MSKRILRVQRLLSFRMLQGWPGLPDHGNLCAAHPNHCKYEWCLLSLLLPGHPLQLQQLPSADLVPAVGIAALRAVVETVALMATSAMSSARRQHLVNLASRRRSRQARLPHLSNTPCS